MDIEPPSPVKMDVKHSRTFAHYFMTLVGAPNTQKFRELETRERQYLHLYYLWIKYHFISTLYHQHSIPHQLIRDPPRLRFWLRVLNPITPFFGGLQLVESNTRYTLFCNMIAIGRGAFWVLPAIAWGKHVLETHPNGQKICDYLENDGYFIGHMLVPHKYNAKYQEKYRQVKYEYYLTRGLPIPPEYMPKDEQVQEGGQEKGKKTFEPQIAMRIGEKDMPISSPSTVVAEGKEQLSGRERMIKSTFSVQQKESDVSKRPAQGHSSKGEEGDQRSWTKWLWWGK